MQIIAFALLFWGSLGLATAASYPDLLFQSGSNFGGFGRLVFSESAGRYQLLDGRFNTYVVDGQQIRPMRLDEGGGTMGNPKSVVALDRKIFGNPAYGQILEYDPATGAIGEKFSYTPFNFGGSGSPGALFASEKALLILDGLKLITLDSRLKKISEKTLEQQPRHVRLSPQFAQAGAKLFDVVIDNPNTYTDCVDGCHLPTVIRQTTIDFSNPADIKVASVEEQVKEQQHFTHKTVDSTRQGWFLAKTTFGKSPPTVAFHTFSHLAVATAELALPLGATISAATKTAPVWLVLEQKNAGPQLAHIDWKGKELVLSAFPLEWLKGTSHIFALTTDSSGRLYVAANHQLAVYETSGPTPRLALQQEFVNGHGSSQFQIDSLLSAVLAKTTVVADRSRLESTLAKDYWNEKDHLAIEAEIEKLNSNDTWAIAVFTELLKKRQQSFHGGIAYSVKALEKFGTAAAAAVPSLIYATMEGSSIRGEALPLVVAAIAKIDPQGTATRAMLPDCIKKTYVCEHVGKQVLAGLH